MGRLDEREEARKEGRMSGDERSQRREGRLTDMEMKSRGRLRYELFLHFLFVFTLQKKRASEA